VSFLALTLKISLDKENYNWLIAVLLGSLASFVSNLGLTLQKLQHQRSAAISDARKYYVQPLWMVGLCLIILGSLADFTALSFGPQSLVAPLGSLTLVCNAILAPLLLREQISRHELLATFIIIFGSTIAVIFASHEDKLYSISDLFDFYWGVPWLLYFFSISAFVAAVLLFIRKMHTFEREGDKQELLARYRVLYRLAYPSISGAVGAQSVLLAKCSVELLVNTVEHRGMFLADYRSYLVMASLGATIFLQIMWLNEGLRRFSASYTVPVFTAFWIILSICSGLVFYKEYKGMSWTRLGTFWLGVCITIGGVYIISSRHRSVRVANRHDHDEDLVQQEQERLLATH